MNATQLRNMTKKQLIEKLQELRKQLIELRAKKRTNQNNMQIRNTKRDIARVLTILREASFVEKESKETQNEKVKKEKKTENQNKKKDEEANKKEEKKTKNEDAVEDKKEKTKEEKAKDEK